jgi:glutamate-1-semialdehyde 2,1-aminomutase
MRQAKLGPTSREYVAAAGEVLPGAALHPHRALPDEVNTIFVRSRGSRIWDVDGNEYIDYIMGAGVHLLGHAHPRIAEAVRQQLDAGTHFMMVSDIAISLARKIVQAVPCADSVKFTGTGNEATYSALRVARTFTGKSKIMKFDGGYHGTHDYAVWNSDPTRPPEYPRGRPDSAGIPAVIGDHVLLAPFNDLDQTASLIKRYRDELAAVIVEPYFRTVKPRPGFLQALRQVTRENNVVLIFDEIITGFRLAWGGAQQLYGVTPDLATLGKAIGGGLPIGAVVGVDDIMRCFDPVMKAQGRYAVSSGTFSGNPLSCAAGLAMLEELEKPGVYEELNRLGQRLRSGLERACHSAKVSARAVGEGSIVDVVFTDQDVYDHRSGLKADVAMARRVATELLRRRVLPLMPPGGKLFLSLAHTDDDVDETVVAFEDALREAGR